MIDPTGAFRTRGVPIIRKDILANPGLSVPLWLAALGWIYLVAMAHMHGGLPLCVGGQVGFGGQMHASLLAQWALLDARVAIHWTIMVIAMMMPLLATHLSVAVAKSLPRYRWHVLWAAMAGYLGIWIVLGIPYLGLFLLATALGDVSSWPIAPVLIYGAAILWCFVPLRQRALRRCHPVPAFYGNAGSHTRAAAVWGASLGLYCAVVCFLAMAAPMLSGQGAIGMLMTTHLLLAERRALRPDPRFLALVLVLLFAGSLMT